ncbi:MAG: AsmA family protein, partial [Deinococcus-Thermus bacterium]|nr:AsmA family protein [Deinococcota bacterium]
MAALPFLIPTDTVIARVQEQVRQQTGRALAVDGPVELSVLPTAAVRLEQVSLANPEGARAATFASIGALEVAIAPLPLLSGRVEIERFRLVEPVINLEVAEDGTPN